MFLAGVKQVASYNAEEENPCIFQVKRFIYQRQAWEDFMDYTDTLQAGGCSISGRQGLVIAREMEPESALFRGIRVNDGRSSVWDH